MLETLVVLCGCQWLGEVLAHALHLPVPGPVLGMLILFVGLMWRRAIPAVLQREVPRFLSYLPLFFVPAGVGLINYLPLLRDYFWSLAVVLVLASVLTLLLTAALLKLLWTRQRIRQLPEARRERFK